MQAVPEAHKEGEEARFESFNRYSFVFLTWIYRKKKKVFVYKYKLILSLALRYLVDLFINKLKTKFNNIFYRMILNTERIHNSFWRNIPVRGKKMSSKVLFVGKKKRRPRPFGHCAPKLWSLATENELKLIIFALNYPTVLVHTKTIIHLSVGR